LPNPIKTPGDPDIQKINCKLKVEKTDITMASSFEMDSHPAHLSK